MNKYRIISLVTLILSFFVGFFVYQSEISDSSKFKFRYGLDLSGGVALTYKADISKIESSKIDDSMDALRDVVERRVNLFGVTEPIVQIEKGGVFADAGSQQRLIIELPGVTDVDSAIKMIGQTPQLDFRIVKNEALAILSVNSSSTATTSDQSSTTDLEKAFERTPINGSLLKRAQVGFDSISNEPLVTIEFNDEGKKLFADLTKNNTGKELAIFLDGALKNVATIREAITDGTAQISGGFTAEEAKNLVRDLNYGALPLPIELIETQSIGPTLGEEVLSAGVKASMIGFLAIVVYLIFVYRLPGLLASLALLIYMILNLALFKLIPVTITAAGIAGLILSIGMAVDANILMFARMREEFLNGKSISSSVKDGFSRAWESVRDGNTSGIIIAIILFWFGTSLIKGFALTLLIGVLLSILTASSLSRVFMLSVLPEKETRLSRILFGVKETKDKSLK